MTHWAVTLSSMEEQLEVALRDSRGVWYSAGNYAAAAQSWWLQAGAAGWSNHVLALANRRPSPEGHPRGTITGVRIRMTGDGTARRIRLRNLLLLRPHPVMSPRKRPRILAGTVTGGLLPLTSATVVAESREGRWTAPVNEQATFEIRNLPHGDPVRCKLIADGREYCSIRGAVAVMTCDQWDWDFRIGISRG